MQNISKKTDRSALILNKRRKGFTLIELIVVIAVIGILVLLAMPMFMGHTQKAKATQIKNDIKVAEGVLLEYLIKHDDSLPTGEIVDLSTPLSEGRLWETKGIADSIEPGDYQDITEMPGIVAMKSKLKGYFVGNEDGKVYFVSDVLVAGENVGTGEDGAGTKICSKLTKITELSEIEPHLDKFLYYDEDDMEVSIREYINDSDSVHDYAFYRHDSGSVYFFGHDKWADGDEYKEIVNVDDVDEYYYEEIHGGEFEKGDELGVEIPSDCIGKIFGDEGGNDTTLLCSDIQDDEFRPIDIPWSETLVGSGEIFGAPSDINLEEFIQILFSEPDAPQLSKVEAYEYRGDKYINICVGDEDGCMGVNYENIVTRIMNGEGIVINSKYKADYNNDGTVINGDNGCSLREASDWVEVFPNSGIYKKGGVVFATEDVAFVTSWSESEGMEIELSNDETVGDLIFKGNSIIGFQNTFAQETMNEILSNGVKINEIDYNIEYLGIADNKTRERVKNSNLFSISFGGSIDFEIPDTVLGVYEGMFYGLTGELILPDGLKEIGDYAFHIQEGSGINGITSVNIPDSVETIGSYAFSNNKIASINLPNGITNIGERAFINNMIETLTIPGTLKTVETEAFKNNNLNSLSLSYGVEEIGEAAFSANNLKTLSIPGSTTLVRRDAFRENAITSLTLNNGIEHIGSSAFYNNAISSLTIPDSVSTIGGSAFMHNEISDITIGIGMENIEINTFRNNALTKVSIPSNIKLIKDSAFQYNKITEVTFEGENTKFSRRLDIENNEPFRYNGPNSDSVDLWAALEKEVVFYSTWMYDIDDNKWKH